MIRNTDARPRGMNLNRPLRVPGHSGGRPPVLAYDEIESEREMADRMDKSDVDPDLSLDDETEKQELDLPELNQLSREQLENLARKFFRLYMTGSAEPPAGTSDRRAQDRKRRNLGMDARSVASFKERFPDAARIDVR